MSDMIAVGTFVATLGGGGGVATILTVQHVRGLSKQESLHSLY